MRNRNFFLLQLFCLLQCTAFSQQDISKLESAIDSIFSYLDKPNSPGCAVIVLEDGNVIAQKNYGMASIEMAVQFNQNTVVRIPYSEAREFISIAAVLMEQDGILSLDDKVRKFFPDLPEWSEPLTLWDLLNHSSGFVDEWATLLLYQNNMSNRFETSQFLHLLYTQPEPEVEPGEGYLYSNSDFGLLRLIMEKASGKRLDAWMQERIFSSMHMEQTQMQNNPLDIIPNKAEMYSMSEGNMYRHQVVQKTSPGGNYFILTSASDLMVWVSAITDLTSEIHAAYAYLLENVRMMPGKENHLITGYTFSELIGSEVIFHEGVTGYNYITRIPEKKLTIITLGNRDGDGFGFENKALTNYLMHIPPPVYPKMITQPVTVAVDELKKYEGNYRWLNQSSWEGPNQTRKYSTVFLQDKKLMMRYSGNYIIELTPVGKDMFYYEEGFGAQIQFYRIMVNSPLRISVTYDDGYPGVKMAIDTAEMWKPTPQMLTEFTGKFYSAHLDYYWNFELAEGKLFLKRQGLPDTELEPDGENQFHYIGEKYPGAGFDSWVLFHKNDYGNITHITVWSARVMHHRFDKVE